MTNSIKVSRQFVADFERVTAFYGLDAEELDEARKAARADIEQASITFNALANQIKGETA